MLHKPTRRDVFRYGGGALLAQRIGVARSFLLPGSKMGLQGPGLISGGGTPPISLIAHAKAGGLNAATTPAIDSRGANFAIIAAALFNNTSGGVITDTAGNSWIALTNQNSASTDLQFWYSANISTSAVHTFTCTQAGAAPGICVAVFSNVITAILPFDVESGSGTNDPGAITPSLNNSLVIGGCGQGQAAGDPSTCTGGFTITDILAVLGGTNMGCAMSYQIQTSAASADPVWNATGSPRATKAAAFKHKP